ncbi:MAG: ACP S-malonyltransferase [Thermotogaceae bacterium]|nr:ACP S-malonyltransferase [Thermotogaceae bacterium]
MKTALLFPGQGSQAPGMGKKIFEEHEPSRRYLEEAKEILGFDLRTLIFGEDPEVLKPTEIAQPAIYTVSAMYFDYFRSKGNSFDAVAGHSLGEYNALFAAGVFSFSEGLSLVRKRGLLMAGSTEKRGGMAAIIGIPFETVAQIADRFSEVWIANINTPNQTVLSGAIDQVREAMNQAKSAGAKIAVELNVSTAFHTPYMKNAENELNAAINQCVFHAPEVPVFSNYTGGFSEDLGQIKENLARQLTGQVRWSQILSEMETRGVEGVYEIGYGNVLRGMLKSFPRLKFLPI